MSALNLEIVFAKNSSASFAERIAAVFGAFAGCILPAHLVKDAAKGAQTLLSGEVVDRDLFATYFDATPITAELVRRARAESKPLEVWCAFVAGFPKNRKPAPQAYFRFIFDAGTPSERFFPIVSAALSPDNFRFSFGANGAPLLTAPSRDRGGPIDQSWARSSEVARRDLARSVARLKDAEIHVRGEGVGPNALEDLARAVPGLIVDKK